MCVMIKLFREKIQTKKGDFGELLVDEYIKSRKKMIPYEPVWPGAHPFDRILASPDKKDLLILDVKSKARRQMYPDQGIDFKHYIQYKTISEKYNIPVFLVFVDEGMGEAYGNYLRNLEIPVSIRVRDQEKDYPSIEFSGAKIIYFPISNMITLFHLTSEQQKALRDLSSRNPSYRYANNCSVSCEVSTPAFVTARSKE